MVILFAANLVPVFGQIAVSLLLPVFAGGMVCMCHHQQEGGQAEIADLFAGFRHNSGGLVIVGVIFATGIFGLAFIAFMISQRRCRRQRDHRAASPASASPSVR